MQPRERRATLVFLAATIAVGVVLWLARIQTGGPLGATSTPAPTAVGFVDEPTTALTSDDRFRLTLELDHSVWHVGQPITGRVRLEWLGPGVTIARGSGSGVLGVDVHQVNGSIVLGWGGTDDCASYNIGASAPIVAGLTKNGGWSADDPNAAFYEAFFKDPLYRLPAGDWEFKGQADVYVRECEAGGEHRLTTPTVRVHVVP
jgi:hypothetical protein